MKKNSQIHLVIETEAINDLKKEATENEITFSELIRRKIKTPYAINCIKLMVEEMHRKMMKS